MDFVISIPDVQCTSILKLNGKLSLKNVIKYKEQTKLYYYSYFVVYNMQQLRIFKKYGEWRRSII